MAGDAKFLTGAEAVGATTLVEADLLGLVIGTLVFGTEERTTADTVDRTVGEATVFVFVDAEGLVTIGATGLALEIVLLTTLGAAALTGAWEEGLYPTAAEILPKLGAAFFTALGAEDLPPVGVPVFENNAVEFLTGAEEGLTGFGVAFFTGVDWFLTTEGAAPLVTMGALLILVDAALLEETEGFLTAVEVTGLREDLL